MHMHCKYVHDQLGCASNGSHVEAISTLEVTALMMHICSSQLCNLARVARISQPGRLRVHHYRKHG